MLQLPDELKTNIAFILEKAVVVNAAVCRRSLSADMTEMVELVASEIAVMALVTADILDGMDGTETVLMRGELSFRLRRIAFRCLEIQETDEAAELRKHIRAVDELCGHVAEITGVPKPEPPAETGLVPTDLPTIEEAAAALRLSTGENADAGKLRAEIRALRELLTSLVMERDHLETVVLKEIEAAYMRQLGGLEAEIYHAECELRLLRRRLELMQASVNRDQPICEREIDETLREQMGEFRKTYAEFKRRVEEAEARPARKPAARKAASAEEQDTELECKRLYRKLVKALHPDLHPDQDERAKMLFRKAVPAYKALDLKTLREIDELLKEDVPDGAELLLDELRQEKKHLLEMVRGVRGEISAMKERYPYTKKWILEDPARLQAEKERLAERLLRTTEAVKRYRERIERMREEHG